MLQNLYGKRLTNLKRVINRQMSVEITEGVSFKTIAREWRLKWSPDNNKKSLASVQKALKVLIKHKDTLSKLHGVESVQRVVCGGCLDFKVIVALPIEDFKNWEKSEFAPESEFLKEVSEIPGVSTVETQTYTLEPVI